MYPNLRAEMARKSLSMSALADLSGIPKSTLSGKINGRTKVTLDEAISIKDALAVSLPLEVLFARGE